MIYLGEKSEYSGGETVRRKKLIKSANKFRPSGAQLLRVLFSFFFSETRDCKTQTMTILHMGEQPFEGDEEKDKFLICEN